MHFFFILQRNGSRGRLRAGRAVPVILSLEELELVFDAIAGLCYGELERLPRLVGDLWEEERETSDQCVRARLSTTLLGSMSQ